MIEGKYEERRKGMMSVRRKEWPWKGRKWVAREERREGE